MTDRCAGTVQRKPYQLEGREKEQEMRTVKSYEMEVMVRVPRWRGRRMLEQEDTLTCTGATRIRRKSRVKSEGNSTTKSHRRLQSSSSITYEGQVGCVYTRCAFADLFREFGEPDVLGDAWI